MRPVFFAPAVVVGFMFYSHGGINTHSCSSYSYAYGHGCRSCSDWICPMGQYRVRCSSYSDSYCKQCTNKPAGNYTYTSPGNENDCQYEPCSTDPSNTELFLCEGVVAPPPQGFAADTSTDLVFYVEMPVDNVTFASLSQKYSAVIRSIAGDAAQSVTVGSVFDVPASVFNAAQRRGDSTVSTVRQAECDVPMPKGDNYVVGASFFVLSVSNASRLTY